MRINAAFGLVVFFAMSSSGALASPPGEWVERGNQLFGDGRYDEAREAYLQARAGYEAPPPELLHDLAAVEFKLGNLVEARELWVQAASLKDAAFESRCRYNLGNIEYAEALALRDAGQPGTREKLDEAIAYYQDAIRLDPSFLNARANLELAARLKREIEEQAESQPSSQPSSQSSESQPSSQPSEENSDSSDSESNSSTSQPSDSQDPSESDPESQPATQPSPEPEPETQPAEPESRPADQPESQPAQTQPAPQPQSGSESQEDAGERRMSEAEAERLLQMVRDREKARRRALLLREAARHRPVERDW